MALIPCTALLALFPLFYCIVHGWLSWASGWSCLVFFLLIISFLFFLHGRVHLHAYWARLAFFYYYFRVQLDYELRDIESVSGSNGAPL